MNDAFGTSPQAGEPPGAFDRRALGASEGLEISVHRRLTRRWGGFLAYTLSRSTRAFGRASLPSSFDRTHVVNAAAIRDFGRGYKAGGRVLFYTGGPKMTAAADGTPVPLDERLPPFFRLDVRLEKRWTVGRGWLSAVLEVQNATLSEEAIGVSCGATGCETQWLGPVTIPSLGVEGGF